jgi:uridine kinase
MAILPLLRAHLLAIPCPHPLRVAIDGVDAAGKTTLADQLALGLQQGGRQVLRASIDCFHHPRAYRYRQGAESPEGYYEDSFDLAAVRRLLLDPLGAAPAVGGKTSYIVYTHLFDFRNDSPNPSDAVHLAPNAILLFDGVFLQRPELRDCWECVIFVQVSFETVLKRAVQRDSGVMGGAQATCKRYLRRYIPAQQRYLSECQPELHADIIIQNDDPHNPGVIFKPENLGDRKR